jgi:16S rRNA (guanine(966)-N(2))-methyltransferase RsmD
LRGRRLESAPGARPTAERTREALFSIWQERLREARFLELFSGSGVVGIEARSRGAGELVFIDRSVRSLRALERNLRTVGVRAQRIVHGSLPAALHREDLATLLPVDLIYADPPYDYLAYRDLLDAMASVLAPHGEFAIEHSNRVELPDQVPALLRTTHKTYGETALSLYRPRHR